MVVLLLDATMAQLTTAFALSYRLQVADVTCYKIEILPECVMTDVTVITALVLCRRLLQLLQAREPSQKNVIRSYDSGMWCCLVQEALVSHVLSLAKASHVVTPKHIAVLLYSRVPPFVAGGPHQSWLLQG